MHLTRDEEPIIAQCTPKGSGAVALLRISGTGACGVVAKMAQLASGDSLEKVPTHTIHYGHVVHLRKKAIIDEVLFLVMHAPKTYTGQDTVEISCHNNQFVVEDIMVCALMCGARRAQPGEFTRRAFLHGKMDLVQAEAIHEIIGAQTQQALCASLSQLQGSLSHYVIEIEDEVLELLTYVEASFEFLDEEQRDLDFDQMVRSKISLLKHKLCSVQENFSAAKRIRQGIRVVLLGSVNVGKSTLFNALLGVNRAIVTDIAGTTRDVIEATLERDGSFWTLVDTAGLRKSSDVIEKDGIARSKVAAEQADIILLIVDVSAPLKPQQTALYRQLISNYPAKTIVVANKIDAKVKETGIMLTKMLKGQSAHVEVSAIKKMGIEELLLCIDRKISKLFTCLNMPFLLNERQYGLLSEIREKIKIIENDYSNRIQYELIAYNIRDILQCLAGLTGKNFNEEFLDKVFSDFCIGK